MTLRTVLLSLQALLAAAEPDDPQDAVVANQVGVCASGFIFTTFIRHFSVLFRQRVYTGTVCFAICYCGLVSKQRIHRTSIQLTALAVAIKNYPNAKCVPLPVISEVCV